MSVLSFFQKPLDEKLISLKYRILLLYQAVFPGKPYRITIHKNLKWLVYKDWHNSAAVFYGNFDKKETEFLKSFVQSGWNVFDIGTHYGYYSLLLSQVVGKTGKVFSFEPAPLNRERLTKHVKINQLKNVRIEPKAMGEQPGVAQFFLADHNTGGNTLNPLSKYKYSKTIEVPIITLDEYSVKEKIERLDFIKIDVEGFELKVFQGGENTLRKFKPVILLELLEVFGKPWNEGAKKEGGVIKFLESLDYEFFRIEDNSVLKTIQVNEVRKQNNYLAVPKSRKKELEKYIDQS